jgi:hypothetical protein
MTTGCFITCPRCKGSGETYRQYDSAPSICDMCDKEEDEVVPAGVGLVALPLLPELACEDECDDLVNPDFLNEGLDHIPPDLGNTPPF